MNFDPLKQGGTLPLTEKYSLSLITKEDLPDILEMLEDPRVYKYLYFAPSPVEVYESFFVPVIEQTEQALAKGEWPASVVTVIRSRKHKFAGMIGLSAVALLPGNYELGYQLPERAWGKGLATLGCQAMTELAFRELGAHKVAADCYDSNLGSIRVLEKSGYGREGLQNDYYRKGDDIHDRVLFGMTSAEFDLL